MCVNLRLLVIQTITLIHLHQMAPKSQSSHRDIVVVVCVDVCPLKSNMFD